MTKPVAAFILFLLVTLPSFSARKKPVTPVMADITARGRALYEYDQAAWHATDAVQASNPPAASVGRYIARKSEIGWTVAFGHLNQSRDQFLIAYEATQDISLQDFTVKRFDPPQQDTSLYLAAAKAIDTALANFAGEKRPYNVAVLPAPASQLYVYVYPAQTDAKVYPLGGDVRYLITTDGSAIVEKRQLHKTVLERRGELPEGVTPKASFHTHVLSDVPEDTDVFFVLTRKPTMPEYIGTIHKKLYIINPDGTILEGKL